MSLSVKPEDGEAVLFGKAVNELQSDVVVSDDDGKSASYTVTISVAETSEP